MKTADFSVSGLNLFAVKKLQIKTQKTIFSINYKMGLVLPFSAYPNVLLLGAYWFFENRGETKLLTMKKIFLDQQYYVFE